MSLHSSGVKEKTINSKEVVGAKVLPGAKGILSSLKRQRILQRAVRQSDLGGLVTKKKSSRMWITLGIPSLFLIIHLIMQVPTAIQRGALC